MYHTILLAYDGSRDGRKALREGAYIAQKFNANTHLLAVMRLSWEHTIGADIGTHSMLNADREHYEQTLAEGIERLHALGLDASGHLVQGDPGEQIARYAEHVEADLVVIGHRSRGPLERWWSTQVSPSLLNRVNCSLLIAMHPSEDELSYSSSK